MVGAGGLLVAFEGLDGSGKSTQLALCSDWLAARRGAPPLRLREPGGTPLGERVRELLLAGGALSPRAEMLLYMACRAELYASVVLPALAAGRAVLLDRSQYSTAAYQGAGLGLDEAEIFAMARAATGGRAPDRVVLLDLPADRAARRAAERQAAEGGAPDRIEARDAAYFGRVAEAYRRFARDDPGRFRVVDATQPPEAVAAAVREALADVA